MSRFALRLYPTLQTGPPPVFLNPADVCKVSNRINAESLNVQRWKLSNVQKLLT